MVNIYYPQISLNLRFICKIPAEKSDIVLPDHVTLFMNQSLAMMN